MRRRCELAADEASTSQGRKAQPGLRRELGLLGLVAVSMCTVIGAGINVISVEIQSKVDGVGWMVPLAFVLGVTPAVFCALSYASLASAMPRAGGGYIYISRAFHPFLGFMATASKWFGLSSVIGLLAYLDIPLMRDAAELWGYTGLAAVLNSAVGTLILPLLMVWVFWLVNVLGMRLFGATCIALMFLMLSGGAVLIFTGLTRSPADFAAVMQAQQGIDVGQIVRESSAPVGGLAELIKATGVLFFAYIGFATISQAGGEARNPTKLLPRAFVLSAVAIAGYYVLYATAVYHVMPWQYVAHAVAESEAELTAPGLIGPLIPGVLAGFVAFTAAIALANDIPPMLMAVSRLFFSWARDGIFPKGLAAVNRLFGTPHWALTACALVASAVVIGCNVLGESGFFVVLDMVVLALLFTYMMVAAALIAFPRRNPDLYARVAFIRNRRGQVLVALGSILTVACLFVSVLSPDIAKLAEGLGDGSFLKALAGSATVLWLVVMAIATVIFWTMWGRASACGEDPAAVFRALPDEGPDEIEVPHIA